MTILYIDTSSSYLYTGLVRDGSLLVQVKESFNKDLSVYALSRIERMFKEVNLHPTDVDKVIVVNGPGSFTGIRIGITIAKTFAWALKCQITTITSLEAMAVSTSYNGFKVPIIDARRGYVFAGIYDDSNNPVMVNKYISLEVLKAAVDSLNSNYVYITNDNIKIDKVDYTPNILEIVTKYKDKEPINPHAVNPEYLKKTEAEETKGLDFEC